MQTDTQTESTEEKRNADIIVDWAPEGGETIQKGKRKGGYKTRGEARGRRPETIQKGRRKCDYQSRGDARAGMPERREEEKGGYKRRREARGGRPETIQKGRRNGGYKSRGEVRRGRPDIIQKRKRKGGSGGVGCLSRLRQLSTALIVLRCASPHGPNECKNKYKSGGEPEGEGARKKEKTAIKIEGRPGGGLRQHRREKGNVAINVEGMPEVGGHVQY